MARRLRLAPRARGLAAGFAAIREELGLPGRFPPEVRAEGWAAAERPPRHPDRTEVDLVTIDPPRSRDLDQAFWAGRRGDGYRVAYAIADPGAFVAPGGLLDRESRRRGMTLYSPDVRTPLYPEMLGEGAASLLPGRDVPAVLWEVDLDAAGEPVTVRVARATVRSRAQLTYAGVQRDLDAGTAAEPLLLLREIGRLRQEREVARGGVSLRTPAQEVVSTDGVYALAYVAPLPVEDWNAQVSLLTGMCAARIMLDGGVGLLRTMPRPDERSVAALRRGAAGLGVPWVEPYAAFVRSLDPAVPAHAALLSLATTLLRGAAYTAFAALDGAPPAVGEHSAIAAPYAHATAPLRRLADRFVSETVLALHAGAEVPDWCRAALPELPGLMAAADRRERDLERAVLDYVEAAVLERRVGETFDAVVTDVDERGALVQLAEPAVRARLDGTAPLGELVTVRLTVADPVARRVRFAPA
jgi:exoribonuclease R